MLNKIKSLCFALFLNQIMAASNEVLMPKELFANHIFYYVFQDPISINELQENYYNFCLLSKNYNHQTKNFWNQNWQLIMAKACDECRFERLYFAGIFCHVNNDIKEYFEKHLSLYKTFFYLSANEGVVSHPTLEWFQTLDPNCTIFSSNCQMSLLECCIKAHYYPIKNKTELCIDLVKRGAQYDIWMYCGIVEKPEEEALIDNVETIKKESQDPYGPFLLSEFIARHIRCNIILAEEIVKRGTCAQDIFIKRFPELETYRKKEIIPKAALPKNFINNHHFSEIRYIQLVLKSTFIPYLIYPYRSMIKQSDNTYKIDIYEGDIYYLKKDLKNIQSVFFRYFEETKNGSFIEKTFQTQYSSINEVMKKFKQQYKYENKDSEDKNAYQYFKDFSKLTEISINHNILEWLTTIDQKILNTEIELKKYIDQKSIPISQDIISSFDKLANTIQEPLITNIIISSLNKLTNIIQEPLITNIIPTPKKKNTLINKIIQLFTIKKIYFGILFMSGITLLFMKFKNLVKSI